MAGVRLEFAQFGHFDHFNIYRNTVSTAIDNLGQPIGASSTMYYEDLTVEPDQNYYYRIGVFRDSIEEFSEEIHIRTEVAFDPPYDLIVEFKNDETNRLELNWKLDGFVDEQRYYCSETPIDPENLPAHKAVLVGDARSHIDYDVELGKAYYVCVGSVKNGFGKISQSLKVYAISNSLFKARSDFITNLVDLAGLTWTAVGGASIHGGALSFDGSGDYLTCPSTDNLHFKNSEDVTIRFKIKINSFKSSGIATIFSTWNTPTSNGYGVRVTTSGIQLIFWNISFFPIFAYTVNFGTEFEVSIERKDMVWRAYINGNQIGTNQTQTSNYAATNPALFYMGSGIYEGYGSDRNLNGALSNFQIIKGLAVGNGQPTTQRI